MTDTEILAAIEAGSQFAIRKLSRLDVASRIAGGMLAENGWPWSEPSGRDAREEQASKFAARVFQIADALIAANETKRCSAGEIHAAIVDSANHLHESQ